MKLKLRLIFILFLFAGQTLLAAAPVISSFSPATGAIGTLVTINGTNLTSPTAFTIGGKPAVIVSNSGTKLVGMVMPGATSGGVVITTADGTANSSGSFTVTPSLVPNVQQGPKLVAGGGIGQTFQGWDVALSSDGNTAVVGGPGNPNSAQVGAAWIYVKTNGNWAQQGPKLTGSGGGYFDQGSSVAISADGNTVAIGGYFNEGGIWIFTRTGTTWTQQGPMLRGTGASNKSLQGVSVSLSADGNTLAESGPLDQTNKGAVWIFTRTGNIWTQAGNKLTVTPTGNSGTSLGQNLALSANGKMLIVGGNADDAYRGAAWIFARNGQLWKQQGPKLVGSGGGLNDEQGLSVAINADGSTAAIGGPVADSGQGAVWVFTRTDSTWTQQGSKFAGTGVVGTGAQQGYTVSLSADGNTLAEAGYIDSNSQGAVWLFTRSGTTWSQHGSKLVGTGNTQAALQGRRVTLSADGNSLAEGGYEDNHNTGAVWIFTNSVLPQPQIITFAQFAAKIYGNADFAPGATSTNNTLPIIYGSSDTLVAKVLNNKIHIVGVGATNITAAQPGNNEFIDAVPHTQPLTVTKALLTIKADDKKSVKGLPLAALTISYAGFVNADTVSNLTTPPHITTTVTKSSPAGTYPINVSGAASSSYAFTYVRGTYSLIDTPIIASFSPSSGPVGTLVTIKGVNLLALTSISIAGQPAAVISNSDSLLVARVTRDTANTVNAQIVIITPNGTFTTKNYFAITPTGYIGNAIPFKVIGSRPAGVPNQGTSVAVSADGNTAVAGAPGDNNGLGAVYVYIRKGATWIQQGLKLAGTGNTGASHQGGSVAISADGNHIVAGGNTDNQGRGAIWLFKRTGQTWAQDGSKLTASDASGIAGQGYAVAINSTGNEILVGGPNDATGAGAAWVFTHTGNGWGQAYPKITGSNEIGAANFGYAVSLNSDGALAIIGGPADNANQGAAWLFTKASSWRASLKLIGTNNEGAAKQGFAAAISADGNTAIVGGPDDHGQRGAAWIYSFRDGSWAQQGEKLAGIIASVGHAAQGAAVSLSADGNKAFIGSPGNLDSLGTGWLFTRTQGIWDAVPNRFVGPGSLGMPQQGYSTGISADGNILMVGAPEDNDGQGAVWFYSTGQRLDNTITFNQPATTTYGVADISPIATSLNHATPIIFTSHNPAIATIVNGKIHLTGTGSVTITASQPADSVYNAGAPVSQALIINRPALTVTADNQTKVEGDANPPLTASYSGFVYNENPLVLTALPVLTTVVTTATAAGGIYHIQANGATAANYIITYVQGIFTVTKRSLHSITLKNNLYQQDVLAADTPYVHPAVSPNGDGINDVFTIDNIQYYPENTVSIIDRNGNSVFEIAGYDNVNNAFDGRLANKGKLLPAGTYYYLLTYKNKGIQKIKKGFVVLRY